jgi:hypothetical protein
VDVFALTPETRAFFAAAAWRAAEELRLFAALRDSAEARGSVEARDSVEALAARLGVRPRRLRALIGALACEGLLAPDASPPHVPVPDDGWGRLAEVIRSDRPLDAKKHERSFHEHLAQVGEAPARELAARLMEWAEPPTLLDLGGGLGTYARAFVERGGSAVVIDCPDVIAHAAPAARLEWVAGDIFEIERAGFGVVLLCNVLHLYGAEECARLCARAARMGRVVVVKDLDRRTPAGSWFALNMALYTESGDVHDPAQILEWLGGGVVEKIGEHIVVVR